MTFILGRMWEKEKILVTNIFSFSCFQKAFSLSLTINLQEIILRKPVFIPLLQFPFIHTKHISSCYLQLLRIRTKLKVCGLRKEPNNSMVIPPNTGLGWIKTLTLYLTTKKLDLSKFKVFANNTHAESICRF